MPLFKIYNQEAHESNAITHNMMNSRYKTNNENTVTFTLDGKHNENCL